MDYPRLSVEEARKVIGKLVTDAAKDGSITVITKNDVPAAAIVPLTVLLREGQVGPSEGKQ